ncbi:hypothetical protein [Agriterribacter sp.]|uniref:hypothetical protein n=1 Tax=Agriterribacter sp. TaxID=2821509 RepID=UPI002CDC8600|nr:hypothetical protein [Agriterribacter sp.]HRO44964.1 hypothetical protein [Agriterribacter sp.]HRQ15702.1 hypothetical protein [Agriterribacter sp.]
MKKKRSQQYLQQKHEKTNPLKKEDIQSNPDSRIDQDFPGFPYAPAKEEVIHPKTGTQKKTAALQQKDGEK